MCDPRLLIALLLWPTALFSQSIAELRQRAAKLDVLRRAAAVALQRADSARAEPLDTVRGGALVVLVRTRESDRIRSSVAAAWLALDSLYGNAARRLAAHPVVLQFMSGRVQYQTHETDRLLQVVAAENADSADIAHQLMAAGALSMQRLTDTAMTAWLQTTLLPGLHQGAADARTYVELVTAPSIAVRHCFSGDREGCRLALGLLAGEDSLLVWYDAEERRAMVRGSGELTNSRTRRFIDACLGQRDDAACTTTLRLLVRAEPPLSLEARHGFARQALQRGGRGAYERLLRSRGTLLQRFALAAGIPADSLVDEWHRRVLAARPLPVTFTPRTGWIAWGWGVLFSLLALRSSRWR